MRGQDTGKRNQGAAPARPQMQAFVSTRPSASGSLVLVPPIRGGLVKRGREGGGRMDTGRGSGVPFPQDLDQRIIAVPRLPG